MSLSRIHGDGTGDHDVISEDEVRVELRRILSSEEFPASSRNRKVLEFLVERSLSEPGIRTTAYDIATKIYGRHDSFSTSNDPIVRIEMARLRRDIETYYLKGGRGNPLRITLPKGRYLAMVRRAAAEAPTAVRMDGFSEKIIQLSLLGWAGRGVEAASLYRQVVGERPEDVFRLVDKVKRRFNDGSVADLLLEGVRRAAPGVHDGRGDGRTAVQMTAPQRGSLG